MHFESSGIDVVPWLPPLVALAISFFTSMGGVSGAFLLLPFQMSFLGYTHPSVSATNQLYNVVAIPSGVVRYVREGRMVWPLTWTVVAGTLPGVFIGAVVRVRYLPDAAGFKLFAGLVLLYVGVRMVVDLARRSGEESAEKRFRDVVRSRTKGGCHETSDEPVLAPVQVEKPTLRHIRYGFQGETFTIPLWGVFTLSALVGLVAGIYGIGGGAILAPFFVSFFRLPVYTVAGAALAGTFITSLAGVGFYQAIAPFYPDQSVAPDWPLGLLFGLGGMGGMYLGARFQKHVPAAAIKWMLAGIILYTALTYVVGFFL